jgi:hypothetical protein
MTNPYKSAIEACVRCAQDCERYAAEFAGTMGKTVLSCLDAAELCSTAATLMSRFSRITPEICQLSAHACERCAAECDKSPDEQLTGCAEICRACAEQCLKVAEEGPFDMEVQGSAVSASLAAAM